MPSLFLLTLVLRPTPDVAPVSLWAKNWGRTENVDVRARASVDSLTGRPARKELRYGHHCSCVDILLLRFAAVSRAQSRTENLNMEDPRMLWLTITNVALGVVIIIGRDGSVRDLL